MGLMGIDSAAVEFQWKAAPKEELGSRRQSLRGIEFIDENGEGAGSVYESRRKARILDQAARSHALNGAHLHPKERKVLASQ